MASSSLPLPTGSAETDALRRKELRRHKAFATGLLLVAAVVFVACQWYETQVDPHAAWVGYVSAAAEAGMVGGLADWFAVTALFRYPLGLKIPHTAIIKKKKDQLGEALSSFVGENFLNAELITEKVSQAKIPERIAEWMIEPSHAYKVSHEVGRLTANAVAAVDPADAEAVISQGIIAKLAAPKWGPPLGKGLEQLMQEGYLEPLINEIIGWAHRKAIGSEALIIRILDERAPSWAPKFVNELVGDKVYRELITWTAAVRDNPNHEARQALERFIRKFAYDVQYDPVMIERVESLKQDILHSTTAQSLPGALWEKTQAGIIEAAQNPDSIVRVKLMEACIHWGTQVRDDDALRANLDRYITSTAAFLADNYATEVTSIISETIARWDAEEASEKIELMVGKDLQYIRVNGTVVGAVAGFVIYTIAQLLFIV
ncbi:DUF445 domain-containing protein [Corynebacterium sp. HS2168-gen11]|uniref:DUF445 domain-containing protein n=1 Tax=Corynebacterium sp. HS2168-gen11 TaxID=2974027 RepID=UPI00216B63AC|nr:DUF445 family protein [Corynebacterium sp. HS2168-gen11]MCS4535616.1 DUF445 family protein [Corynebacterium sp. HS2168-gen11]